MSRNYLANNILFAVSALLREAAINTEQTLDTAMLMEISSILKLKTRREDNSNEANGMEEADMLYDLGATVEGTFSFEKMQAQHAGFILAYALGIDTPAAWGTGYKHVITPTTDMNNPFFTAAQRLGATILKRRLASCLVDKVTMTFAKDSWAKLSASIVGTGKYTDNVIEETVSGFYDATSLTLAANGVQGATATARLDSIHQIRVQVPSTLEWKDVVFSAASDASPAVITMTAPGGTHTACNFKITYVPTESGWMTFPARVTESPLRVSDLVMKLGGKWNGTSFLGGHTIDAEIESVEYSLDNQMKVEFRPGGTGTYANYAQRDGRRQFLKLDRQSRDTILQQLMKNNEYFGAYVKATGAEFETGKNYYVEGIFPRCNVLTDDFKINGKQIAEAGDIQILQDDTYGSCIWTVANKVAGYAQ